MRRREFYTTAVCLRFCPDEKLACWGYRKTDDESHFATSTYAIKASPLLPPWLLVS